MLQKRIRNDVLKNIGGFDGTNILDTILKFNGNKEEWREIGKLNQKKGYHAVSEINFNQIRAYTNCN